MKKVPPYILAACAVAALLAAATFAYFLRAKPAAAPTIPGGGVINEPCGPIPPCPPGEGPCRLPQSLPC